MKTRIFRSPRADYYGDEVETADKVYTDSHLAEFAANGFNGIWLHARLRDLVRTEAFPSLGAGADRRGASLSALIARADSHGVGVYLYLDEPRAFPADDPFWDAHPEVRGESGSSGMDGWDRTAAVCTSHPRTIAFLEEGARRLFEHCAGLAGVILITRSEHHSHCYSHVDRVACPRCRTRRIHEVIAEVVNAIGRGARVAAPDARVVAWNWSWPEGADLKIVEALDARTILMAGFERGGIKEIAGRKRVIDEYSLSYVGPSECFLRIRDAARARDLPVYAKLQIGTTHELATVNNLPLLPNLFEKARWLQIHNVDGTMATWNFGNRFSLNTYAFTRFLAEDLRHATKDVALATVACEYLGVDDPAGVLAAWNAFERAFDYYPFSVSFLYKGPINYALAYPLPRPDDAQRPMQRSWVPLSYPFGTNLQEAVDGWVGADVSCEAPHGRFTFGEVRSCLRALAREFAGGVERYASALAGARSDHARRELANARVIAHAVRSTRNIFDAYHLARVAMPFDAQAWRAVARDEVANLDGVLPLLRGEAELGFHIEAQSWFFDEASVRAKREALAPML